MSNRELTAKQQRFCEEYLIDLNATQAAIRSGYTEKSARVTACKMLTNANIELKIAELKANRSEETRIDAAWVLKQAVEVHNRCMVASKVTTRSGEPVKDDDGDPIYSFEHAGANKSLEIIGKHIDVQAFNENLSIKSGNEVTPWGEVKASVDKLKDD